MWIVFEKQDVLVNLFEVSLEIHFELLLGFCIGKNGLTLLTLLQFLSILFDTLTLKQR